LQRHGNGFAAANLGFQLGPVNYQINLEKAVEPRSSRRKTKYSGKPLAHPLGELRYPVKQLILLVFFVTFVVDPRKSS
jgi:hypothetical protein